MGRRFKVGIVVLFLLLFNLPKSGYSQALTDTVISVEPSSSTVETCLNQTIAIQVQDVVDLTGYHLEIGFDPAAIQVTDVVNGGFLDDAWKTFSMSLRTLLIILMGKLCLVWCNKMMPVSL